MAGQNNLWDNPVSDFFFPAAPQAPSISKQLGKSYQWAGGDELAKQFGYPNWEALVRHQGTEQATADLMAHFDPIFNQQKITDMTQTSGAMAALQLQLQQKYQQPMLQTMMDSEKAVDPQYFALRTALGNEAQANLGHGLSPQQNQFFAQQLQGQAMANGMGDSPLSWANQAQQLTGMNMAQQQQNFANAGNFLNNYNLFGAPNIGVADFGTNGMSAGPGVNDILKLKAATSAVNMAEQTQRYNSIGAFGGSVMGMFSMGGGGGSQQPSYNAPQAYGYNSPQFSNQGMSGDWNSAGGRGY